MAISSRDVARLFASRALFLNPSLPTLPASAFSRRAGPKRLIVFCNGESPLSAVAFCFTPENSLLMSDGRAIHAVSLGALDVEGIRSVTVLHCKGSALSEPFVSRGEFIASVPFPLIPGQWFSLYADPIAAADDGAWPTANFDGELLPLCPPVFTSQKIMAYAKDQPMEGIDLYESYVSVSIPDLHIDAQATISREANHLRISTQSPNAQSQPSLVALPLSIAFEAIHEGLYGVTKLVIQNVDGDQALFVGTLPSLP